MRTDDYVEIQQLLARYCHVVDNKQWDQLASIFTPDAGVTVVGIYPRTTGIEAIIPLYSTVMRHPLAHESTSLIVTEESETVTRHRVEVGDRPGQRKCRRRCVRRRGGAHSRGLADQGARRSPGRRPGHHLAVTSGRATAVVVGGSIAGSFVARVLADHFERVIVFDKDDLPGGAVARPGRPTGRPLSRPAGSGPHGGRGVVSRVCR